MRSRSLVIVFFLSQLLFAAANKIPVSKLLEQMVHRSTLTEPGAQPFYLKATITDKDDSEGDANGTVEEYWASPTKWRRVVKLHEFSQTRIVNGDKVYEDNQGDYFPLDSEKLANEIVDPLPKSAVDLINTLNLVATEPGSGAGQCMVEKNFDDSEGQKTRVLLAYNCDTGLLVYLWSPTCCYGVMTDYRKFHNKMVAYATKDDPINIQIQILRDFDAKDELLFAVPQSSPADKRMMTEKLNETKVLALLVSKAEIQWPAARKTRDETMRVDVAIGRDGEVKEASTYSPVDNTVENAVLSAVRKWTFRPQNVDGVPAQIETTFFIPFPADYLEANAAQPITPIFNKMRAVGDLRIDGAPAFHEKARFHSEDGAAKGTYEETWVSPRKWRREVRVDDTLVVEVRRGEVFYRTFAGKFAPRLPDDVIDALSFSFPGEKGGDHPAAGWSAANTNLDNLPVLRLSNGHISPEGRPDGLTVMYFVEENTGLIRGRYHGSTQTAFDDFQPFGEKSVARKLTMQGSDVNTVEITIDSLEAAPDVGDDLFSLPGAKLSYNFGEDQRFTQPRAIYTVQPSISGWRGNVICDVKIDDRGHVRDVDVKGTTDESVIKAIRAALMNWEYDPATINGHPSVGFVHVQVEVK